MSETKTGHFLIFRSYSDPIQLTPTLGVGKSFCVNPMMVFVPMGRTYVYILAS